MSDTSKTTTGNPELADDILEGAEAIAEFLCGSKAYRRKIYYLAEHKSKRNLDP
jgi:hypothetical protein